MKSNKYYDAQDYLEINNSRYDDHGRSIAKALSERSLDPNIVNTWVGTNFQVPISKDERFITFEIAIQTIANAIENWNNSREVDKEVIGIKCQYQGECSKPLSIDDWRIFLSIFPEGINTKLFPCTLDEYKRMKKQFNESKNKPNWMIFPVIDGGNHINEKAELALLSLIYSGKGDGSRPPTLDPLTLIPTWYEIGREALNESLIPIKVFTEYVQKMGGEVLIVDTPTEDAFKVAKSSLNEPEQVEFERNKAIVLQFAQEICDQRADRGEGEITARNISEALAIKLKNDGRVKGNRGPYAANTVRTLFLKGWVPVPSNKENGT